MCKREIMRVASRVGVLEVLCVGSITGLIRVVMLVCEGVGCAGAAHNLGYYAYMCAMPVRAECVCKGGTFVDDEVVDVFKVTIFAILPFYYLNFTNRGISASRGSMADETGFYEANKVSFMCWGRS
jgi:hypothetical protein